MLSHSYGTPLKLARGEIKKNYTTSNLTILQTNLNSGFGSEGAPVFNMKTHKVVAICVSGNNIVYSRDEAYKRETGRLRAKLHKQNPNDPLRLNDCLRLTDIKID